MTDEMTARRSGAIALNVGAVVAVAFLVRCAVAFGVLGRMPSLHDAIEYTAVGSSLSRGLAGTEFFFIPPGWPLVLASAYRLFGESLIITRLVTILTSTAAVILTMILARQASGARRTILWTGWIAALYPPSVMMSGQALASHLALLLLLLSACLILSAWTRGQWWKYALAGAVLGWECLVRPSALTVLSGLALGGVVIYWRERRAGRRGRARALLAGTTTGLLAAAIVILPILRHNATRGAGWVISTNNERNLFLGNNPHTPHYKTGHFGQREPEELTPEARDYLRRFVPGDPRALDLEQRTVLRREAVSFVVANPGVTAWRTLNRIRAFWGFDYYMSRVIQNHYALTLKEALPLFVIESGAYCIVALLVLAGLFVPTDERMRATAGASQPAAASMRWSGFLLSMVLLYQLPYALAFAIGTFHFPVMGILMPLAGAAAARAHGAGEGKRMLRTRGFQIAVLVFMLIQIEYAYHSILLA